jgi:beta-N-acetylhexosaminidase
MSIHQLARASSSGSTRWRLGALIAGTLAALLTTNLPAPHANAQPPAAALTPRQQAGQRIIYSYPGLTPPQSLLAHIRHGEAAGVIFFGENISSPTQIGSVIQRLRHAQQQSPISASLLLMTDQEGGVVRRLPGEPTLSAKQIGQSANPAAAATSAGTGAGRNLTSVGMNVNLAPVLDVFYQPGNFIDKYQRSYSNDAATVGVLGGNFITAQQQTGVAATAKHFPGLGSAATSQDTDARPVTLAVDLSTLRTKDEAPYRAAIAAHVKLIMVSWAIYPALDASHSAGLSSTVVRSELRTRLGYHGVTITDGLEAGALTGIGTPGQRATLAAQAGMDLILCSARNVTQGEDATAALANALAGGQLDPNAFRAAVDRVITLRNSLP